ncbi:RICIN domain-containing protein [Actinoplanes sp. NBRC 101535]|uniref:RICIN domain-containing protein n=1 Tax=Actinoplanes sp. NBRC 101535 TaxID=3032196 RepID=UPI0025530940|nr:RICIN domain-containing protein [Actinoplanes sp. NBRC 101535]
MPRLRRPVVLGLVFGLAGLLGAGGFAARQAAAATEPLAGSQVSAGDMRILVRAAASCPALTPARLAGQVMVASGFGAEPVPEMRDGGATGVAALTAEQWRAAAPSADADPTDRAAAVTALAVTVCRLTGQARALGLDEDPWRIALAAHRRGMDQVVAVGGIPVDAADYVGTVERYATWYALQPAFGGAAPTPVAVGAGVVPPVPDQYVTLIAAAGERCDEMPPARIAAQLMAMSGFDPDLLGPTGEQGIAQFRPVMWTGYAKAKKKQTPWQPSAAIPALARTMCKLVRESGGQYGPALAAFTRGDARAVSPLAELVTEAETTYATDTRLGGAPPPVAASVPASETPLAGQPPSAAPVPSLSPSPVQTGRNQPVVKAADRGADGSYGPYFLLNLASGLCADLKSFGTNPAGTPVQQFTCGKTIKENQEWVFVPAGKDAAGYQHYRLRNTTDNLCMDPPGTGAASAGARLTTATCTGGDNQTFRLEPTTVTGGFEYYWLRNIVSDLCLDVPGAGTATQGLDAPLQLAACNAGGDHEWALVQKSEW